jgi:hypothetical protein
MSQSVVNTNISSVSAITGNRGNLPQGVMAINMGTAEANGSAATLNFPTTAGTFAAGTEKVGAYQGSIMAGVAAAAGVQQLITLTFAVAHGWTAKTHEIVVTLVATSASSAALTVGNASGSFTDTTIVVRREAGAVAGAPGNSCNLDAATMLIRVLKRGVVFA